MLGSATFTTLASSTTMNWTTATIARTAFALARTGRIASLGLMATSDMAVTFLDRDLWALLPGLHDRPYPGEVSSPDAGDRRGARCGRSSRAMARAVIA